MANPDKKLLFHLRGALTGSIVTVLCIFFAACTREREYSDFLRQWQQRNLNSIPDNLDIKIVQSTDGFDRSIIYCKDGRAYIESNSVIGAIFSIHDLMLVQQAGMLGLKSRRVDLPMYWPDLDTIELASSSLYRAVDFRHDFWCSYWTWQEWEEQLDYWVSMGMNTFILPRIPIYLWEQTWREFGLKNDYFNGSKPWIISEYWPESAKSTGASHMISEEFIIFKKILRYANACQAKVLVPGFYGAIPVELIQKDPSQLAFLVKDTLLGRNWYRLGPDQNLFLEIEKILYNHLKALYPGSLYLYFEEEFVLGGKYIFSGGNKGSDWICRTLNSFGQDRIFKLSHKIHDQWSRAGKTSNHKCPQVILPVKSMEKDYSDSGIEYGWGRLLHNSLTIEEAEQLGLLWSNPAGQALVVSPTIADTPAAWEAVMMDWCRAIMPRINTLYCNARYGACKDGQLLSRFLYGKAVQNWHRSKSSAAYGRLVFLFEMPPRLDFAHMSLNVMNNHDLKLMVKLFEKERKYQDSNPLYLADLAKLYILLSSLELHDNVRLHLTKILLYQKWPDKSEIKRTEALFDRHLNLLETTRALIVPGFYQNPNCVLKTIYNKISSFNARHWYELTSWNPDAFWDPDLIRLQKRVWMNFLKSKNSKFQEQLTNWPIPIYQKLRCKSEPVKKKFDLENFRSNIEFGRIEISE